MKNRLCLAVLIVIILSTVWLVIDRWNQPREDENVVSLDGQAQVNLISGGDTSLPDTDLVFEPAFVSATVARDYEQSVTIKVRNTKESPIEVAARTASAFPDLLAQFVGPGSMDQPVTLAPGEALDLHLAVFAPDARQAQYEVELRAGDAIGKAEIKVKQPKIDLRFSVINENKMTLAKTVEIRNRGSSLGDFSVKLSAPYRGAARINPAIRHGNLPIGGKFEVTISPVLFLEFQSLTLDLECHTAGQVVRFPLSFAAPSGSRLIGMRSGTKKETESADWYCTNKPETCAEIQGAPANGSSTDQLIETLEAITEGLCDCSEVDCRQVSDPCKAIRDAKRALAHFLAVKEKYEEVMEEAKNGAHGDKTLFDFTGDVRDQMGAAEFQDDGPHTETVGYAEVPITELVVLPHPENSELDTITAFPRPADASFIFPEEANALPDDERRNLHVGIHMYNVAENPKTIDEIIELKHEQAHQASLTEKFGEYKKGNITWEEWYKLAHEGNVRTGKDVLDHLQEEITHYEQNIKWLEDFLECCSPNCTDAGAGDNPGLRNKGAHLQHDSSDRLTTQPSPFHPISNTNPSPTTQAQEESDAKPDLKPIPELKLRPGLLEAMAYRASFSRHHRGAYSSPSMALPGNSTSESSADSPAYFHVGHKVFVAWHLKGQIVFAEFSASGDRLGEPMVIGQGLWPRIAAHQDSVAVAWQTQTGFQVRVKDDSVWQDSVDLDGEEAAIAFSPKGNLVAVTSKGLWDLAGQEPNRIDSATYTQPALAFDASGNPIVASIDNGKVKLGQDIVAAGSRPTLQTDANGQVHLAYLQDHKLVYRKLAEKGWSEPLVLKARNPQWPVLSMGLKGVRLSYLADAPRGPQALWLCRGLNAAPSKMKHDASIQTVLMPSVAGNVSKVSLIVELALRNSRESYRPHEATIFVNGIEVGRFTDTVPEGRFEFPLNPLQVFYSPGRPVFNRVSIKTRHMNGGHYLVSSGYRLVTTTEWSEFFAFAENEDQLRELDRQRPGVNHDQPDLTILANILDLPVEPPQQPIDFPVIVANLGEARSQLSTLVLNAGTHLESEATVPPLEPDEQYIVTFRIQGGISMAKFEVRQPTPDFKPANDSLSLHLWKGGAIGSPTVQLLPAATDVQPFWVDGKLPLGAKQVGTWSWNEPRAGESFASHSSGITAGRSLHSFSDARESLSLSEGENLIQYVFLNADNPPKDLVLMFGRYTPPLYWGPSPADLPLGRDRICMGELPPTGKWIRLKIPFSELGVKAQEVNRMKFGHLDGQVFWGPTTKSVSRLDLAPRMQVQE